MIMSREKLTNGGWRFAGAVSGADGVVCFTAPKSGLFGIWSCVGKAGDFSHREKYNALCERALAKLNYKRDKRCKTNWRYVGFGGAS